MHKLLIKSVLKVIINVGLVLIECLKAKLILKTPDDSIEKV